MANRLSREDKLRIIAAIYKRDGQRCWYCDRDLMTHTEASAWTGIKPPKGYPTLDHIFPATLGGPNNKKNMRVSCQPCNGAKSHKIEVARLPDDLATCHKLILDLSNDLVTAEVKVRNFRATTSQIARKVRDLTNEIETLRMENP
jgi:hypothetical protein